MRLSGQLNASDFSHRVPTEWEAEWARQPVWMLWRREKSLASACTAPGRLVYGGASLLQTRREALESRRLHMLISGHKSDRQITIPGKKGKRCKVFPTHAWRHIGGVEVRLHSYLLLALDGGELFNSRGSRLFSGKELRWVPQRVWKFRWREVTCPYWHSKPGPSSP